MVGLVLNQELHYRSHQDTTVELKLTFLHDDCCIFSSGGALAQAHHVLREDPEVVLIAYYQLIDGDACAMVVLQAGVPLLWTQQSIEKLRNVCRDCN